MSVYWLLGMEGYFHRDNAGRPPDIKYSIRRPRVLNTIRIGSTVE